MSSYSEVQCVLSYIQWISFEIKMSSGGGYSGTGDRPDLNNHANQCNPNHGQYQGHKSTYSGTGTRADLNNHANQLNPNNSRYNSGKK